jgi:hypothetical protein
MQPKVAGQAAPPPAALMLLEGMSQKRHFNCKSIHFLNSFKFSLRYFNVFYEFVFATINVVALPPMNLIRGAGRRQSKEPTTLADKRFRSSSNQNDPHLTLAKSDTTAPRACLYLEGIFS